MAGMISSAKARVAVALNVPPDNGEDDGGAAA
jgi:hypothetical protein